MKQFSLNKGHFSVQNKLGWRSETAKICQNILRHGGGSRGQVVVMIQLTTTELFFSQLEQFFYSCPRFIDRLSSCKRIKMKTLNSSKPSRLWWAQYHPCQLASKAVRNNTKFSVCPDQQRMYRHLGKMTKTARGKQWDFSHSWNPLRKQRKSLLSTAAEGLRQDAATRWAGAGFSSAADKGAARPIPDGKLIHSRNEGDWMCPGAPGLTHWIQAPRVRQQPAVREGDKEGCTCKSCCHILQNTKNREQQSPKALVPDRQNQGERLLVLQKVLMHWADWWLKPSRRKKMFIKRLITVLQLTLLGSLLWYPKFYRKKNKLRNLHLYFALSVLCPAHSLFLEYNDMLGWKTKW